MWKDFREFIARGNVFDLAVGIIIGAAFTSVVNSLVKDIIMPPVGVATGGVDFSELYISLSGETYPSRKAAEEAGAATLNYGVFLNNCISFLIVAFVIFLLTKGYNRLRAKEEAKPPSPTEKECPYCRLRIPIAATRCAHCTSQLTA
jgi:large conductance mechanosensitive channel